MSLLTSVKNVFQSPAKLDLRAEMQRRKGQRLTMLEQFKRHGELTTKDLMRIGTGCSSRLRELRDDGHVIVAVYLKPGMWRYIYKGKRRDV